jgi:hypothetical protein
LAQHIQGQKRRHGLQNAIGKYNLRVPARLQDDFFLLLQDWRININAHVSSSASNDSHSRLDALAVQIRQLLLSYGTDLICCYFSNLLSLWLF